MSESKSKGIEINEEALPGGGFRYRIKKEDFEIIVARRIAEHNEETRRQRGEETET